MDIAERSSHDYQMIDISGKINRLRDSIVLKSYLNSHLDKKNLKLALNLSQVTYLDSGALNVIIYCHNMLKKKKGNLVLIAPNEYVRDVLEVVGLHNLVQIYNTEEEFDYAVAQD